MDSKPNSCSGDSTNKLFTAGLTVSAAVASTSAVMTAFTHTRGHRSRLGARSGKRRSTRNSPR
jgi:hypothetical protein